MGLIGGLIYVIVILGLGRSPKINNYHAKQNVTEETS